MVSKYVFIYIFRLGEQLVLTTFFQNTKISFKDIHFVDKIKANFVAIRHSIIHLTLSSSETSRSGGHGLGSSGLDQSGLPASPSTARSHRRMASAPHVPRRTVSRLTSNNSSSTENSNVNLNNNNSVKLHNR